MTIKRTFDLPAQLADRRGENYVKEKVEFQHIISTECVRHILVMEIHPVSRTNSVLKVKKRINLKCSKAENNSSNGAILSFWTFSPMSHEKENPAFVGWVEVRLEVEVTERLLEVGVISCYRQWQSVRFKQRNKYLVVSKQDTGSEVDLHKGQQVRKSARGGDVLSRTSLYIWYHLSGCRACYTIGSKMHLQQ